jgi:class 3 adenylate cyclase
MASGENRRLATILFLDIVGSTPLAHDLGEHRWPVLLSQFRETVRADLKRFGGHEEDTTGDGFFTTFAQPATGIRCGAGIAYDVRDLGLEIRVGLHTGECEVSEGKLAG